MDTLASLYSPGYYSTGSDHPSGYLSENEGTQIFYSEGIDGYIAYRHAGKKYCVIVAGISAQGNNKKTLFEAFERHVKCLGRNIIAVQLLRDDADILASKGYTVNQIGMSYATKLSDFTLKGTRFIKLRNKISRSRRAGIKVYELSRDVDVNKDICHQLDQIDAQWLGEKGKKELEFLIGQRDDPSVANSNKRIFIGMNEDKVVGYIQYTRCVGKYSGWMHDLTRRVPRAPTGVMEHINSEAINRFIEEESDYLHYGFTPLAGLDEELEIKESYSKKANWILNKLYEKGAKIYPAEEQLKYKSKWYPSDCFSEYIAFEKGFTLGGLLAFMKMTNAI